jgi:hypothetical protein
MSKHFRISPACHERLFAVAVEGHRLHSVLKSGRTVNDKVEIVCPDDDAEILLKTIIVVCPDEAVTDCS